jgi:hypothetical protein
MSEPTHTCHVCSHAYQTRDAAYLMRPHCCPRCLAPRRRLLVCTPTAIEAWLLGLYGHDASVEDFGFLEHVLRVQALDEKAVRAVLDEIRKLDIPNLITSINTQKEALKSFDLLGLDQALADLGAESQMGILAWRLDQIEHRSVAILQAERRHHERILQERCNDPS